MAANAAAQGIYSRINTRKDIAERGVNIFPISAPSTVSVLTTDSFAVIPVISAAQARQSPKPNGANSGAASEPSAARILSPLSETSPKRRSKLSRSHIRTLESRITVNARAAKSFAFSHISSRTLRAVGIR